LLNICVTEGINAIISLNDLELPILAENREDFEAKGVKLVVSSKNVIDITFDKYKTYKFALENGLYTPDTYIDIEKAIYALEVNKLKFPLILKPRWGSASIGIEIVHNEEELRLAFRLLTIRLERTILVEASKGAENEAILIQEFINGQEYGVDIVNDLDAKHRATIVKKKLAMRAGETDKAITVDDKHLQSAGKKIGNALKHIGNLDCDFFYANGKYYLLEMNSRFGGGYPFSHEAGVNTPLAIVTWLLNEEIDDELLKPEYNRAFSKYDSLMKIPYNES
jgi:carbamoyl-phosphate synthase large subunit